jgi:hypothetical protein
MTCKNIQKRVAVGSKTWSELPTATTATPLVCAVGYPPQCGGLKDDLYHFVFAGHPMWMRWMRWVRWSFPSPAYGQSAVSGQPAEAKGRRARYDPSSTSRMTKENEMTGTPENEKGKSGMTEEANKLRAWHYAEGKWAEGPDPVSEAWAADGWKGSGVEALKRLGYVLDFEVGSHEYNGGFAVWKRHDPPRHVIAAGMEDLGEFFYVDASPDLREICARWAQLARDVVLIELIQEVQRHEGYIADYEDDVVATIARKATHGAGQRYQSREEGRRSR